MNSNKRSWLIVILVILAITFLIYITSPKDCKIDADCFNKRFENCKSVKYTQIKDNNLYEYKVIGKEGKECKFEAKLLRLEPGADVTVKALLENKDMKCKIPLKTYKSLDEIENMVTFCTGPLKESIYTLLVKRMYGSIIQNLGKIVEETRKVIVK